MRHEHDPGGESDRPATAGEWPDGTGPRQDEHLRGEGVATYDPTLDSGYESTGTVTRKSKTWKVLARDS